MAYDEEDWSGQFLGLGTLHDLRDAEKREPPLWRAKSVSRNAAEALRKASSRPQTRPPGFGRWK